MLAAMCAVLGVLSLDFGNMKITFESLPTILGAALFGPLDGMAIGMVGSLIYQLLKYGFSVTTLLWILPYAASGFIVGSYAKKRGFDMSAKQLIFIAVLSELIITTLNTGVMYIDSKVYGYYSFIYIFGTIIPRYVLCVGKAVVYGVSLPLLMRAARAALGHSAPDSD